MHHKAAGQISANCAVDIVRFQPVQAFEQVRTHLSGWRSFTSTASSGIEVGCICSLSILHSIWLHYTHRVCTVLRLLKHHLQGKNKKSTTPSKGFHLKCSPKCLIQPCMHLDCPIIHLCIFSERQTAESFWYHVRFWASPWPCLGEKGKGRHLKRQTREYSSIHSGVHLCVFYQGYLPP